MVKLADRLYRAYWVEDRDDSEVAVIASSAAECGLDPAALAALGDDAAV